MLNFANMSRKIRLTGRIGHQMRDGGSTAFILNEAAGATYVEHPARSGESPPELAGIFNNSIQTVDVGAELWLRPSCVQSGS